MKLHIGSRTRAGGWTTLDIEPGPDVDHVGDCKDLSRFETGSIEAIYASHVLEHRGFRIDLPQTLGEWFRVLKPGATAMISVPDLDTLCRLFVRPDMTPDDRFMVMMMMFGGQTDAHDFHFVGLNAEFLSYFLDQAGFKPIERVPDFGLFDDTSRSTFHGVPISLNLRATKP